MTFFDQMRNGIQLNSPPKRIVSIVPSQTELLFDLGVSDRVVGITKYCIHPEKWLRTKTLVGGTKKLDLEAIHRLNPDLIIANIEENTKEEVLKLCRKYPVWMSNVRKFEDALQMIEGIGIVTDTVGRAQQLSSAINEAFSAIKRKQNRSALYLIWRKPWMAAGNDTFIHSMLEKIGLINCLADDFRYPTLTVDRMRALNPQLILLSSEPYPFAEKHIDELRIIVPSAKIVLVDGEMFSWYGSRMLKSPAYFNQLDI